MAKTKVVVEKVSKVQKLEHLLLGNLPLTLSILFVIVLAAIAYSPNGNFVRKFAALLFR